MPNRDKTDRQAEADFLRRSVDTRIRRLRGLVDSIETQAHNALNDAESGRGQYSTVGEIFVKELAWGLASVGVEQILTTAAMADRYAIEEHMTKEQES